MRGSIALRPGDLAEDVHHTVIVLVSHPTRIVAHAVRYAEAMRPDHLLAVTVLADGRDRADAEREWADAGFDVPLEVLDDPYRDVTSVIVDFIDDADARWADDTLTVVIPEFVVTRWWQHLLHNQSAFAIKARLLYRRDTVVTSVPFHVD